MDVYHIPVCPFSQRLKILLTLKGAQDAVAFDVVDITKPREEWLLQLSRGSTALPIMDLGGVLVQYLEDAFPAPPVVKLYYDYAKGAGNGALLPGRSLPSFTFDTHWRDRPWPPKDEYGYSATDVELGL